MMMDRINTIWQQLESQESGTSGLLRVRYSPDIAAQLYLGLLTSEKQRCLLLRVKNTGIKSFPVDKNLKGLKVEKISDPHQQDAVFLNLILLNQYSQEVFNVLIQDIINKISPLTDEKHILKFFVARIETWRMLFEKTDQDALSAEAQQGLYGELFFLRKWILVSGEEKDRCVQAWLGIDNDLRDFQIGQWAIEVKTTRGNNHQKIHINSERQLDTSKLDQLWLYHLSLEIQQQNGETLNQIVDSMCELLMEDALVLTEFKSKLLRGGYLLSHKSFYESRGYQIREETFYTVKDNFPRIEESQVPNGVGDVKYSIILSEYSRFIINESIVFEIIK
jgi:hypothetical protein